MPNPDDTKLPGDTDHAHSGDTAGTNPLSGAPAATPSSTPGAAAPANPDDEFLDYEPLTPELLEEEAIRGDFVMRWAVVLLALLMASTRINEPRTLLHMKTGEYIAVNKTVPKVDVFSASIPGRPWTNLSWGFDLMTHLIHSPTALSLVKALLMALAFGFLVHISRPGVSSWWGSITAAAAVVACMRQFTVEPQVMTILGTCALLWILHTSSIRQASSRLVWSLVPLFLLWANLDTRAWIGLFFLLLYALGHQIQALISREPNKGEQDVPPATLWIVTAACLVVVNFHPFVFQVLGAPFALYGQEYPAYREYLLQLPGGVPYYGVQYFPLFKPEFWNNANIPVGVGIGLMAIAGAALILNFSQMDIRWLLLYLGAVALSFATVREIPVCSLVFCAVATLNSQAWYQSEFRQTYEVTTSEILLSRGGRIFTVLLLFGIAFMGGTGRLAPNELAQVGYGLDPQLANLKQAISDQLQNSFDDKTFNTSVAFGDILIFLDKKPYIDTRTALYAGTGDEENIVLKQLKMRKQITNPAEREWRDEWNQLGITQAFVRTGLNPDSETMFPLLSQGANWVLTRLGAGGAVFYRVDPSNVPLMNYLRTNRLNFNDEAIENAEPVSLKHESISPKSFYEKFLYTRKREAPNKIAEALLLVRISRAVSQGANRSPVAIFRNAPALAILGIRRAHEGLAINPDCPQGYVALGIGYAFLARVEAGAVMQNRRRFSENIHYLEAVAAFNQALIVDPYNIEVLRELYDLYSTAGRPDLELRTLQDLTQAYTGAGKKILVRTKQEEDQLQQEQTIFENLKHDRETMVEEMDKAIRDRMSEGQSIPQIAQFCIQNGFYLRALEQLEKATEIMSQNPQLQQMRIALLLETGEIAKAEDAAKMFEATAAQSGLPDWQFTVANAYLPSGDHAKAIGVLSQMANERGRQGMIDLMRNMAPSPSRNMLEPWPVNAAVSGARFLSEDLNASADARLRSAQLLVEMGEMEDARKNLEAILADHPDYAYRPMVGYYLWLLTGKAVDVDPPSNNVPLLFEPDEKPAEVKATAKP